MPAGQDALHHLLAADRLVVAGAMLGFQPRAVGEQVVQSDSPLVLRCAGKEARDAVFDPELALHFKLQNGRPGELLGDRADREDCI